MNMILPTIEEINPDIQEKLARQVKSRTKKQRKAKIKSQKAELKAKKEAEREQAAQKNAEERRAKAMAKKAFNHQLKVFLANPTPSITLGLRMSNLLDINKRPQKLHLRQSKKIEAEYLPKIISLNDQAAILEKDIAELQLAQNLLVKKVHLLSKELDDLGNSQFNMQDRSEYYKELLARAEKESAKLLNKKRNQEKTLKDALNERSTCIGEINSISQTLKNLGESNDTYELINSLIYDELENLAEVKKNFPNSNIVDIKNYLQELMENLNASLDNEKQIKETISSIFNQKFDTKLRMRDLRSQIEALSLQIDDLEQQIIVPSNRLANLQTQINGYHKLLDTELQNNKEEVYKKYAAKQLNGVNMYIPVEKNGKLMALKMWEFYHDAVSALSRLEYGLTGQNMLKIAKFIPNILLDKSVKRALLNKVEWLKHEPVSLVNTSKRSTRLEKQDGVIPRGMQGPKRHHKSRAYLRAIKYLDNFLEMSNCTEQAWQAPLIELLELRAQNQFVYMNDNLLTRMANNIKPEIAEIVLQAYYIDPDEYVFGDYYIETSVDELIEELAA